MDKVFENSPHLRNLYNEQTGNVLGNFYIANGYAEIAGMTGFSKFHFSRLFKEFTGTSFYKYLNVRRISHAERLLLDPQLNVTDAAVLSGFNSISAFMRMFKIIKGCTPTEFRNLYSS